MLNHIRTTYTAAGAPDIRTWHFDFGIADATHAELANVGMLIKVLGTQRGFAWRLTEAGHEPLP